MNTHNTEAWVPLDKDGNEVKVGQKLVDPTGVEYTFQGISHAPGVGSSGKILVSHNDETGETYPRVFDMTLAFKPAMGRKR